MHFRAIFLSLCTYIDGRKKDFSFAFFLPPLLRRLGREKERREEEEKKTRGFFSGNGCPSREGGEG